MFTCHTLALRYVRGLIQWVSGAGVEQSWAPQDMSLGQLPLPIVQVRARLVDTNVVKMTFESTRRGCTDCISPPCRRSPIVAHVPGMPSRLDLVVYAPKADS